MSLVACWADLTSTAQRAGFPNDACLLHLTARAHAGVVLSANDRLATPPPPRAMENWLYIAVAQVRRGVALGPALLRGFPLVYGVAALPALHSALHFAYSTWTSSRVEDYEGHMRSMSALRGPLPTPLADIDRDWSSLGIGVEGRAVTGEFKVLHTLLGDIL